MNTLKITDSQNDTCLTSRKTCETTLRHASCNASRRVMALALTARFASRTTPPPLGGVVMTHRAATRRSKSQPQKS